MSGLEVVTAAQEPVLSLEEAKAHLRVDISDDDALIAAFVAAATAWSEEYMRSALITRVYRYWLDDMPGLVLRLPMPPLQMVEKVSFFDDGDVEHVADGASYFVDNVSRPGRVALRGGWSWPQVDLRVVNGVAVTYKAGWGDSAASVPENIRTAIRLLVGHYYENREAVVTSGAMPKELLFAVTALLNPYRMSMVGGF